MALPVEHATPADVARAHLETTRGATLALVGVLSAQLQSKPLPQPTLRALVRYLLGEEPFLLVMVPAVKYLSIFLPLFQAATLVEDTKLMRMLVDAGARVDALDSSRHGVVFNAVTWNRRKGVAPTTLRALLRDFHAPADVTFTPKHSTTPLQAALVRDAWLSPDGHPASASAADRAVSLEFIRLLLQYGASVQPAEQSVWTRNTSDLASPLNTAVSGQHTALLLAAGADVNGHSVDGISDPLLCVLTYRGDETLWLPDGISKAGVLLAAGAGTGRPDDSTLGERASTAAAAVRALPYVMAHVRDMASGTVVHTPVMLANRCGVYSIVAEWVEVAQFYQRPNEHGQLHERAWVNLEHDSTQDWLPKLEWALRVARMPAQVFVLQDSAVPADPTLNVDAVNAVLTHTARALSRTVTLHDWADDEAVLAQSKVKSPLGLLGSSLHLFAHTPVLRTAALAAVRAFILAGANPHVPEGSPPLDVAVAALPLDFQSQIFDTIIRARQERTTTATGS